MAALHFVAHSSFRQTPLGQPQHLTPSSGSKGKVQGKSYSLGTLVNVLKIPFSASHGRRGGGGGELRWSGSLCKCCLSFWSLYLFHVFVQPCLFVCLLAFAFSSPSALSRCSTHLSHSILFSPSSFLSSFQSLYHARLSLFLSYFSLFILSHFLSLFTPFHSPFSVYIHISSLS